MCQDHRKILTLWDVRPNFRGLSHPLFAGSPRKKDAPAICKPATDPRFQSSVAPRACLYQPSALGVSETANITDITGCVFPVACLFSFAIFDVESFACGLSIAICF